MKIKEKIKKFIGETKQWVSENPGSAMAAAFIGAFVGGFVTAELTRKEAYNEGFHNGQDDTMNHLYSLATEHGGLFEGNFRNHKDGSRMNVRATVLESKER